MVMLHTKTKTDIRTTATWTIAIRTTAT